MPLEDFFDPGIDSRTGHDLNVREVEPGLCEFLLREQTQDAASGT